MPVAVTLKVAGCCSATVMLAGCAVIAGVDAVSPPPQPTKGKVTNSRTEPMRATDNFGQFDAHDLGSKIIRSGFMRMLE